MSPVAEVVGKLRDLSNGGWGVVDVGDVKQEKEGTEDCTLWDTSFGSERGADGTGDFDLDLSVMEKA